MNVTKIGPHEIPHEPSEGMIAEAYRQLLDRGTTASQAEQYLVPAKPSWGGKRHPKYRAFGRGWAVIGIHGFSIGTVIRGTSGWTATGSGQAWSGCPTRDAARRLLFAVQARESRAHKAALQRLIDESGPQVQAAEDALARLTTPQLRRVIDKALVRIERAQR